MGKKLLIAEKPSVARDFAAALGLSFQNRQGYMEAPEAILTWCVGHLVTLSYPEAYDPALARWSLDTLPFLPQSFRYEIIEESRRQYAVVRGLLLRGDVDCIYVCTDAGREGEYIYRLVEQEAGPSPSIPRKRVWIDSQTKEEILRGIREAKDLSAYDSLAGSAYLRAQEDYLMGINFSRVMTLRYGGAISRALGKDRTVLALGRVMTCVLGMVVSREREIRDFVKTPFYRVLCRMQWPGGGEARGEWRLSEGSAWQGSPNVYKDSGFTARKEAEALAAKLEALDPRQGRITKVERKKESKPAPLPYNLAELQNDCAKLFKISPQDSLKIAQELYEKKFITYPRTDARVLSSAVAKEIGKNLRGLAGHPLLGEEAGRILASGLHAHLAKTRYVNDKLVGDHYCILPTGQGMASLSSLPPLVRNVYDLISARFLAIFLPPAVYARQGLEWEAAGEIFAASQKTLLEEGYTRISGLLPWNRGRAGKEGAHDGESPLAGGRPDGEDVQGGQGSKDWRGARKGMAVALEDIQIKEGESSPPKRYSSGSLILAMENAGSLIEDEELRAQIRGSGIGTSATRAAILQKLVHISYLDLHKKTQILTPTCLGEMVYAAVAQALPQLLKPQLTASWEKGLSMVAAGELSQEAYMEKLKDFICRRTQAAKAPPGEIGKILAQIQAVYEQKAFDKKPQKQ